MDTKILIETLIAKVESLQKSNDFLMARVTVLEAELAIYKNKKNSGNSHIPPSRDENRPMKNQSLREKSSKKPGGQQGHEGKTLECSALIDETISYAPDYCNCCGKDLIAFTVRSAVAAIVQKVIFLPILVLRCNMVPM